MSALYIHIPFCLSKCPYCNFYSVKYEKSKAEQYKNAVIRNLKHYDNISGNIYDTVYFGGGTPILLWQEICELMNYIRTSPAAEITVEANPCCSNEENLSALLSSGVNRISFGVQSLDDSELKALGRRHSAAQAEAAIEAAYKCGFKNISADLMLGLEGQTAEGVCSNIRLLSELPVTHISAYMLKIEKGTPFAEGSLSLPDEDSICSIYLSAAQCLESKGFKQYEISNFAKEGYQCRHNLKYWNREEYLGLGPAAHSFTHGNRFYTENDLKAFLSSPIQKTIPEESSELSNAEEYLMLRLRLTEGVSLDEYGKTGGNANELINNLDKIPKEYFSFDGKRISLTPTGFLVSNAVIGALLGY